MAFIVFTLQSNFFSAGLIRSSKLTLCEYPARCSFRRNRSKFLLTVIDALLTKAFQTTYTSIPARTKTPNHFILHYLVISSQPVKHCPPCHAIYTALEKSETSIA